MYPLLALAILVPLAPPAGPPRPSLTGTIQNAAGRPLAGATVFISTAGPRQGVGVL